MNLSERAAVVERLLKQLGNPNVIGVRFYGHVTDVQLAEPIAGVDWSERDTEWGRLCTSRILRDGHPVELSAFALVVAA